MKHLQKIALSQVLVVLICISSYSDSLSGGKKGHGLQDLLGAELEKHRLRKLFGDEYGYNVIATKRPRVTRHELEDTLYKAHREFRDNTYHAILIFYSGYGDNYNFGLQRKILEQGNNFENHI